MWINNSFDMMMSIYCVAETLALSLALPIPVWSSNASGENINSGTELRHSLNN